MIVATRPDPTVRPPSRYLNTVFLHIFYAFGWQNPHKTAVFTQCIFICLSSWHRFGTVGACRRYFLSGKLFPQCHRHCNGFDCAGQPVLVHQSVKYKHYQCNQQKTRLRIAGGYRNDKKADWKNAAYRKPYLSCRQFCWKLHFRDSNGIYPLQPCITDSRTFIF